MERLHFMSENFLELLWLFNLWTMKAVPSIPLFWKLSILESQISKTQQTLQVSKVYCRKANKQANKNKTKEKKPLISLRDYFSIRNCKAWRKPSVVTHINDYVTFDYGQIKFSSRNVWLLCWKWRVSTLTGITCFDILTNISMLFVEYLFDCLIGKVSRIIIHFFFCMFAGSLLLNWWKKGWFLVL